MRRLRFSGDCAVADGAGLLPPGSSNRLLQLRPGPPLPVGSLLQRHEARRHRPIRHLGLPLRLLAAAGRLLAELELRRREFDAAVREAIADEGWPPPPAARRTRVQLEGPLRCWRCDAEEPQGVRYTAEADSELVLGFWPKAQT